MKRELRDKWTAALRDGSHKQGKSALNRRNRFCCLGVLCDVMRIPKVMTPRGDWSYEGQTAMIEGELLIPGSENHEKAYQLKWTLADMNDGTGGKRRYTFPEIADYIEANVPVED